MPLDAATLTGVVAEVRPKLEGARVDKIFQPARDEVLLQLRGTGGSVRLLLTANPAHPRLQLTSTRRENPAAPPMFCMLLRKHLSGGRILKVEQPSMERLVDLTLEARNELGDLVTPHLILEAMGRRANLILTSGDGHIIDCLRRVEMRVDVDIEQQRPLLPGMLYRLPPNRAEKQDPLSLTREEWETMLRSAPAERRLADWLLDQFVGFSPLLCRELACQGAGSADARFSRDNTEGFAETVWQFLENLRAGRLIPCALFQQGKPKDFSCLPLYQYGISMTCRQYDTFSEMLDDFYSAREQAERVQARGRELIRSLTTLRARIARKVASQERECAAAAGREQYRIHGDLITANLYRMEKGQRELRCENFYDPEGAMCTVPLDPLLTPQQNAARCYKQYNKAKTAARILAEQIEKGRGELAYLDSVREALDRAEGERDLAEIRQELEDTGYLRKKKTEGRKAARRTRGTPMEFRSTAGLRISVGRNNTQNDLLTCKLAGRRDLWLHTQKIHGAHVILWCEGQEPDEQSVTEAAILAATFSQGSEGSHVPVDYTPVRYVKKPGGARPGMVIYTTYRTAYVDPDAELAKTLRVK